MDSWLVTITQLPTEDPAARMRMLRTLESLGAAVMREGAYLLPDTAACRQGLEHLSEYIAKSTGTSMVLQVLPLSGAQKLSFRSLFDRSARYAELIKVVDSLKVGFGIADPSAISRVLNKLRRELESISALDFFPDEIQQRAKATIVAAEAAVHKLLFPAQPQAGGKPDEPLRHRVSATRRPASADRLACVWLISRFVYPVLSVSLLDQMAVVLTYP